MNVTRPIVQIVAGCTDRKRLPIPADLRIRAVRAKRPGDLFGTWWRALEQHTSRAVPAVDLYGGDHWTVVRDLPRVAHDAGLDARLWVASAGYGLVPAEAHLRAYGATFTPGHPDSIAEGSASDEIARRWWHSLAGRPGPHRTAPRTLADLALASAGAKLLVVASPRYVRAVADDLVQAVSALRDQDDLLIVSGDPGASHETLRRNWIPSVASLQTTVGGSRLSLHARIARRILEEAARRGIAATAVRDRFIDLARAAPPPQQYDRTPLDDEAVRSFVAQNLRSNPAATHTQLLRALRDSGRACEQSRFRQLFLEVKER
ncbi:hypothetical protein WME90_42720 [Sorangium sp. So ce375]|uniref:hypothetical protein n=1 Tax=Sorangium sp. So ce375 TaxID=3133306 RepID=UPI003F5C35E3